MHHHEQPEKPDGAEQRYLPEPLDDGVVGAVTVLVDGVLSPVVHVHIAKAAHQQLRGGKTVLTGVFCITSLPEKRGSASLRSLTVSS